MLRRARRRAVNSLENVRLPCGERVSVALHVLRSRPYNQDPIVRRLTGGALEFRAEGRTPQKAKAKDVRLFFDFLVIIPSRYLKADNGEIQAGRA